MPYPTAGRKSGMKRQVKRPSTYKKAKFSRAPTGLVKKISMNRAIARQISNFSETKVIGMQAAYEQPLTPIQTGAQTLAYGMCLGTTPSSWTGNYNALLGIPVDQDDGSQQRIGKYVYLKKSTLNCTIDLNTDTSGGPSPPWEFRVIMFKANRKYSPDGIARDPNRSLFLAANASPVGAATGGQSGLSLFMSPLNKRSFTIYRDQKFTLQAPLQGTGTSAVYSQPAGVYGNFKRLQFVMPHSKKVSFDGTAVENYNANFGILVMCRPIGHDGSTSRPEISYQGSTSYVDN